MTVDDRLRAAHARIPEPDAATVARARARLMAALDARRLGRRGARAAANRSTTRPLARRRPGGEAP